MDRLTEMEAFATVVDQGGFTDAARKMGVSKSAVSKHVSSLETRLGTRLLNRTTRRVNPTEIGLIYYDRVRRVLSDAGDADAIASSLRAMPSGDLRLNVYADFGGGPISPVLNHFSLSYHDISVTLDVDADPVELGAGQYDAAIRIGKVQDHRTSTRKLGETTLRMVASPNYLADYGRPKRIDDLTAQGCCIMRPMWRHPCGIYLQPAGKPSISEPRAL